MNNSESIWTKSMIEEQAEKDLAAFIRLRGRPLEFPIFAEEVAECLWGTSVEHQDGLWTPDGEVALARYNPGKNIITINVATSLNTGRTAFSAAHETGHASLHRFLVGNEHAAMQWCREQANELKNDLVEYQADQYAAVLLRPKHAVIKKVGALTGVGPLDLTRHAKTLMDWFGVSRHALEIRLSELGIPAIGCRHSNRNALAAALDEMDVARSSLSG